MMYVTFHVDPLMLFVNCYIAQRYKRQDSRGLRSRAFGLFIESLARPTPGSTGLLVVAAFEST